MQRTNLMPFMHGLEEIMNYLHGRKMTVAAEIITELSPLEIPDNDNTQRQFEDRALALHTTLTEICHLYNYTCALYENAVCQMRTRDDGDH